MVKFYLAQINRFVQRYLAKGCDYMVSTHTTLEQIHARTLYEMHRRIVLVRETTEYLSDNQLKYFIAAKKIKIPYFSPDELIDHCFLGRSHLLTEFQYKRLRRMLDNCIDTGEGIDEFFESIRQRISVKGTDVVIT